MSPSSSAYRCTAGLVCPTTPAVIGVEGIGLVRYLDESKKPRPAFSAIFALSDNGFPGRSSWTLSIASPPRTTDAIATLPWPISRRGGAWPRPP